jgi:hypothetical protein
MRCSNLVTGHTALDGKSGEGHISQQPQLAVGINFVFPQDSAHTVDFVERDTGNIETAVQNLGFLCRVS